MGTLDFHAPTKALFNLKVPINKGLKTALRRKLVCRPRCEKMGVQLTFKCNRFGVIHLHDDIVLYLLENLWNPKQ